MQEYEIYVGGQFKKTEKPLEIVGPYSRKVEFTTYSATEKEFEEATVAAEKVEKEVAEMPIYQRFEILKQVSDELEKNKVHLTRIL